MSPPMITRQVLHCGAVVGVNDDPFVFEIRGEFVHQEHCIPGAIILQPGRIKVTNRIAGIERGTEDVAIGEIIGNEGVERGWIVSGMIDGIRAAGETN